MQIRYVAPLLAFLSPLGCGGSVTLDDAAVDEPKGQRKTSPWCNDDGFCWVTPRPQGNPLRAIDGRGMSAVVAVGNYGTALRFDGVDWSPWPTDTTGPLHDVWVAPDRSAWIHGSEDEEDFLLWMHGEERQRVEAPESGRIGGMAGLSAQDVLIIQDRTLYRGDVEGFAPWFRPDDPELSLFDVEAIAEDDVWLLARTPAIPDGDGGDAVVFHFDGAIWSVVADTRTEPSFDDAKELTLLDDHTVIAHGRRLYAWQGDAFEPVSGDWTGRISAVWGTDVTNLWWSGSGGTFHDGLADSDGEYDGLWGTADGAHLLAVGNHGQIAHRAHGQWIEDEGFSEAIRPLDPTTFGTVPIELWVGGAASAWAASPRAVWRAPDAYNLPLEFFDGDRWTVLDKHAHVVHGSAANNVWLLSSHHVERFDGAHWTSLPLADHPASSWTHGYDLWTAGPSDTWVVGVDPDGHGVVWKWTGTEWSRIVDDEDTVFTQVEGRSSTEVYVLGTDADGSTSLHLLQPQGTVEIELPGTGDWQGLSMDPHTIRVLRDDALLELDGAGWTELHYGFAGYQRRWRRAWHGATGTWVHNGTVAVRRR